MGDVRALATVFAKVEQLAKDEEFGIVASMRRDFGPRHTHYEDFLEDRCASAAGILGIGVPPERERRLLVGAYLTMEYSIEAAALFNPSIALHPDQRGVPKGGARFIMSLRAVGEGHISTTVFHSGTVGPPGGFQMDPPSGRSAKPRIAPDESYDKELIKRKLVEMGADIQGAEPILAMLPDRFSLSQLDAAASAARATGDGGATAQRAISELEWLARANYHLRLAETDDVADLVLFPRAEGESKGIEDMRLVRFEDDDGTIAWFGTYTGFNGRAILPMLMETPDFRDFSMHTLNGACAQNKGMALFPRRVQGRYAMCSRIDGRNLFLMLSDSPHFWNSAVPLAEPKHIWEWRLIGNCGSPIETDEGWLLITHGVGPMRRYSIGAILLDRDDPLRIRGRLALPLISAGEQGRVGYVPNVVYSCGSLVYGNSLYLPYAVSDASTRVAILPLASLLERILRDGP
jgi:predicted GH43/DUF377 family glycosyl hydrolase